MKIKKVLKYLARILSYTFLTILIIFGLSLLFVFVTSKVAKSKNAEPPINLFTIISPSMTPIIDVYDVVVSIKTKPSKIMVGDVISFYSSNPNVNGISVTHRVAQIVQDEDFFYFKTKGDANLSIDSETVPQDKVIGKVYFKIPQLGKVQFFLGSKGGWLIAILLPALAIISYDIYKIAKLIIIKQKIKTYQTEENEVLKEPSKSENIIIEQKEEDLVKELKENKIEVSISQDEVINEKGLEVEKLEVYPTAFEQKETVESLPISEEETLEDESIAFALNPEEDKKEPGKDISQEEVLIIEDIE